MMPGGPGGTPLYPGMQQGGFPMMPQGNPQMMMPPGQMMGGPMMAGPGGMQPQMMAPVQMQQVCTSMILYHLRFNASIQNRKSFDHIGKFNGRLLCLNEISLICICIYSNKVK